MRTLIGVILSFFHLAKLNINILSEHYRAGEEQVFDVTEARIQMLIPPICS